ncbi:MAG: hypothetical protein ACR2G4_10870 [Pyrinomonadaceae bacterium]
MKNIDFAYVLLTYNFLLGSLLIIAGEKLGLIAAGVLRVKRQKVGRLTQLACTTFGVCLVCISVTVSLISFLVS